MHATSSQLKKRSSLIRAMSIVIAWALILTFTVQPTISALTPDQRRLYARQGIMFIDDLCAAGTSGETTTAGDNILTAMTFFVDKGLSPTQAAGIVGNLHAESYGVTPTALENRPGEIGQTPTNGQGFGIAQWTYTSRQAPLVARASAAGVAVNTLDIQLDYVWHELNHGFLDALIALRAAPTVRDATEVILMRYEIPKVKDEAELTKRTGFANQDLETFNKAPRGESGGCTEANTGKAVGKTCADIGLKSEDDNGKGIPNPYVCDSSSLACPAGKDAGIGKGYANGKPYDVRLCMVQGIKVNAFIAEQVDKLITDSKKPACPKTDLASRKGAACAGYGLGKALTGGSFRTMQTQINMRSDPGRACGDGPPLSHYDIYEASASSCDPDTAPPGKSNHQMGLAIDFDGIGKYDRKNPKYLWLDRPENANNANLHNLPTEAWHWSADAH